MKQVGFSIEYNGDTIPVFSTYVENVPYFKICFPSGAKLLHLEQKEGEKLVWTFRGEGTTDLAAIIGKLVEAKTM